MMATLFSSAASSTSSCSFEDSSPNKSRSSTLKFLCSYNGKILPRYRDGKLRYIGGETRVLAVDRSVTFPELHMKMMKLCGWSSVSLRCQLPLGELDTLVSINSNEDIANLIEEYDLPNQDRLLPQKIRVLLYPSPGHVGKAKSSAGRVRHPLCCCGRQKSVRRSSMLHSRPMEIRGMNYIPTSSIMETTGNTTQLCVPFLD